MFDNILQLEKEVKEFEKNILASKDLIDKLGSLLNAVQSLQQSLETSNGQTQELVRQKIEATLKIIGLTAEKLESDSSATKEEIATKLETLFLDVQELEKNNLSQLQESFRTTIANVNKETQSVLQSISKTSEQVSSSNKETQQAVVSQLEDSIRTISENQEKCSTLIITDSEKTKSAILEKLEQTVKAIKSIEDDTIDTTQKALGNAVIDIGNLLVSFKEAVETSNSALIESAKEKLTSTYTEYCKKLEMVSSKYAQNLSETSKQLSDCKDLLIAKQAEFIEKLQNSNIDQLYGKLCNLEQNTTRNFWLLGAGVLTTLVISILTLIMQFGV